MAKSPETPDNTSIQQRIQSTLNTKHKINSVKLMKLSTSPDQTHQNSIQFSFKDYCELVDRFFAPNRRTAAKPAYIASMQIIGLAE